MGKLIKLVRLRVEKGYKVLANRGVANRENGLKLIQEVESIGLAGIKVNIERNNGKYIVNNEIKKGTTEKTLNNCILPILKDYDTSVESQSRVLEFTDNLKSKNYTCKSIMQYIEMTLINEDNYVDIMMEVDYVFSRLLEKKLIALENKQKREERKRKCIKTK